MKLFFYYFGLVLELFGLATMVVVIILFFGKTKMEVLLYMSLLGAFEFYGGYWIMQTFGKK